MEGNKSIKSTISSYNKPISLWHFLEKYVCIIPLIQRDYVQGRKDKVTLRKEFFGHLIESLHDLRPVKLDFIFGCPPPSQKESNHIYPLDGQQRLTSLWILHWYLAFMTGNLSNPEVRERLLRFSYQTRTSSREFCKLLCQPLMHGDMAEEQSVRNITSQPWFSRRFKMDPSVNGMLRSLSEPVHGSGFEQLLKGHDLKRYWEILTGTDCPISFFFKSTYEINVSDPDDLYVKMNARGKKLTDFENFKADLYSFKKYGAYPIFRENIKQLIMDKEAITGLMFEEGDVKSFISKFENEWTNLFWSLRHRESNIVDHIVFEFIHRTILSLILIKQDYDAPQMKPLISHILNHEKYSTITLYSEILTLEFKEFLSDILSGITRANLSCTLINSKFEEIFSEVYFPKYEEQGANSIYSIKEKYDIYYISDISIKRILAFSAASLYFKSINKKNQAFNHLYFKDWLIFCRNLIENSGIDTYSGAQALIKVFFQIDKGCLNIIEYLNNISETDIAVSSKSLQSQFEEEREKAVKIMESRNSEGDDLESVIRVAELRYPFGGSIRFLFTNAYGNFNWDKFKKKKKNFDIILSVPYDRSERISPVAIRTILSYVTDWNDIGTIGINSSYDSWKKILINNPGWVKVVDAFLSAGLNGNRLKTFKSPFIEENQKFTHEELVKSTLLHQTTWDEFYFKPNEHMAVIFRSSVGWKRYLLGSSRNRLISKGVERGDINLDVVQLQLLGNRTHLWGECFYFDLIGNDTPLIFWWNNTSIRRNADDILDIYLVEREGDHNYFPNEENKKEFAITVPLDISYNSFLYNLKILLNKAKKQIFLFPL